MTTAYNKQQSNAKQPQLAAGSITTTTTTTSKSGGGSSSMRLDTSSSATTDPREQAIQQRQRDAAEAKARTLAMYDNMAKSGNAGDKRALDINTYRGRGELPAGIVSGTALQKTDLVEETIRERVRASEENKKRLLAAFDYAAKTQPAGTVRDVDLAAFQGVDVSSFEQEKPQNAATFRSINGVPKVVKVNQSAPSTPQIDINKAPSFTQEQPHLDAYERALRQRKQEADERKARMLANYDAIARSGVCGPKVVVREELEHMDSADGGGVNDDQAAALVDELGLASGGGMPAVKTSPIKGRPTNPKDALLHWCYMKTRSYDNVYVQNFSSSWADGLAFCALLHHFFPDDIDYAKLSSSTRRENFDLAFKVAEEKAKVYPLLETDDMIKMGDKPDWKCIYTYAQALYRGLKPFDPTQK